MNWKEYEKYLFGELCWNCGISTSFSEGKRMRCKKCRKKWNYENRKKEWNLLKLFCAESTSFRASKTLDIAPKTAHKYYMIFRKVLSDLATKEREPLLGEIEMDESYFGGRRKGKRGRGAAGKTAVFGLLERDGKVCALVVPDVSKETLMGKIRKNAEKGSVFYSDNFTSYNDLKRFGKHRKSITQKNSQRRKITLTE